jgi:hypothetical protein
LFLQTFRKLFASPAVPLEVIINVETWVYVYDCETEELIISVPEEHQAHLF